MRPFEDVRILDLTHVLAGPFATYQLAVLGADVIKIEAPTRPDMTREEGVSDELAAAQYGVYFMGQASGKRAITLDLASAAGKQVLTRLIETADVLVQNYAGDALARLGFGPEACQAIKPDLIYCTLSGFGRSGPKADDPAYDVVIQAWSGLMKANVTPDNGPMRVGPPVVDYGTGAQAALAIAAALYQRRQTGKGQVIDVAMADAALMLMSADVVTAGLTGRSPQAHGNAHPHYAGYSTYETADGLLTIGAWTNEQLARLFAVLGEDGRAGEVRATPRRAIHHDRDRDAATIAAHMKTRTADHWEDILNRARVPAARVRSLSEALGEAQTASRRVISRDHPPAAEGAPQAFPVAAFSYAHGTPAIDRPPPRLGEHTDEVLGELGYSASDIATLRADGVV